MEKQLDTNFRIMEQIRGRVDMIVKDPKTAAALKPFYPFGCKRPTFHDEFLPAFNEGTLTINVQVEPGTSLAESNRLGRQVEKLLLDVPEVLSVARRTGRAEMDEHAEGVHSSELDVRLLPFERPKPGLLASIWRAIPGAGSLGTERVGRPRLEVESDIEGRLANLVGVRVNVGQPIAHRLDHVLSGVRAQVAVKIFGPDLRVLRRTAEQVRECMATISGIVQLQVEPHVEISQLRIEPKPEAATYGLNRADLVKLLETAYRGRIVSEILDGERRFDLLVWYDEEARYPEAIGATRRSVFHECHFVWKARQTATLENKATPNVSLPLP